MSGRGRRSREISILEAAGPLAQQRVDGVESAVVVLDSGHDPCMQHPQVGSVDPVASAVLSGQVLVLDPEATAALIEEMFYE